MTDTIMTVSGRTESGYGICIDSADSWIVAVNNAGPDSDPNNITFLGAHPNTDETFVLVDGKACIAVAPPGEPEGFTVSAMEKGVCYNVRRDTWHTVMMAAGGTVAICENRNPEGNRHDLSDEAKARLVKEAMAIFG